MTLPLLLTLPWVLLGLFLAVRVRFPRPLPAAIKGVNPPLSIVVPARNEARNIRACLESLVTSDYGDFEILVVDDRSEDGTGELARSTPAGSGSRIVVLDGAPLPEGWFGKPWACWQGARKARGDLLLFTDADTRHAPDLSVRAVRAMVEDRAHAVTLVGRQRMGSLWERLVQPQFFLLLALRYPNLRRPVSRDHWPGAIANGQFILITRQAYEAIGGHEVVRGEVAEDLRLAQILTRAGYVLTVREAEDGMETRMYTSLSEIVEGWSKNLWMGARQSAGPRLGAAAAPGILLQLLIFWLVPPVLLTASVLGSGSEGVLLWSVVACGCGLLIWAAASVRFGISAAYGLLYPLGAGVALFIVARSWLRRGKIEWKGRLYGLDDGAPARAPNVRRPGDTGS